MNKFFNKDYKHALEGLATYKKWFDSHDRDVTVIVDKVTDILNRLRCTSSDVMRHFSISYAGIPNAGVQIWAWQMDRSLPAAMAHFTNIMLIEVWESSSKITYFELKPHSVHEWWKYRTVYNPSEKDIDDVIRWVSTMKSKYPDWEKSIPWHRRVINRIKWTFFLRIGWMFGV